MSGDARFLRLSEAPQYRESTWALIEKHFPKGESTLDKDPLESEFALLLSPGNESRVWICVDGNHVVSTSSWRPFDVLIPGRDQSLKCAGVGLVVTDPSQRKKGYAASLQKLIENAAREEGVLLSLLWSDLHDFYMKQGFLPAGTEYMWTIDKNEVSEPPEHNSFTITKLTEVSQIKELYEAQRHGPRRDWLQYNKLLDLSDTYGWLAKDAHTHKPIAYALMGKARDLRATIHELVGDPIALPALVYKMSTCVDAKNGELRLQIPPESPFKTALNDLFGPPELSALSYMKILNTSEMCKWINQSGILPSGMALESKSGEPGFVLRRNDTIVWDSPDEGHILQLFFGPWKPAALSIPKTLKTHLMDSQTIGIYFWGFDSV